VREREGDEMVERARYERELGACGLRATDEILEANGDERALQSGRVDLDLLRLARAFGVPAQCCDVYDRRR
jgi:hypothetical protein